MRMTNTKFYRLVVLVTAANVGAFVFGLLRYNYFSTSNADDVSYLRRNLMSTEDQKLYECNCTSNLRESAPPKSSSEFKVPNIVHYIWFNTAKRDLQFNHMLSILSAHKLLDPEVIYFHTNFEPGGEYWEQVKKLPKLKVVFREPPIKLFGEDVKEPMFYTSHSNVDRVKILMEYGGIYLDFDVMITKTFDDLRRHTCTIGLEQTTQACGSVIVCAKSALFLKLWINSYLDDYRMDEWAYNSGKVPFKLAQRFPELVHVEKTKLNRPNFDELDLIWGNKTFDWQSNYAVHTWYRLWKDRSPWYEGIDPDAEYIKTMDSAYGQMARSVYYGSPDLFADIV